MAKAMATVSGKDRVVVLANRKIDDWQKAVIEGAAGAGTPAVTATYADTAQDMEDMADAADVLFAVPGGRVPTAGFVRKAKNLRWIHAASAGVDHLLIPEIVESDIIVTNCPGIHAVTISEHVFSMILAFSRDLIGFMENKRSRLWKRNRISELGGKTLLVVGLGATGREVAKKAKCFGMYVIGTKRRPEPVEWVDEVLGPEQLSEALGRADYVVLCVPLTRETDGLLGAEEIGRMKPGSVLINVSRGEVVDEDALVDALRSGKLRGAGLDVFRREPLPPSSPLWDLPNVIMTPHVAGSREGNIGILTEIFRDNLAKFIRGEPIPNVVDKRRGY